MEKDPTNNLSQHLKHTMKSSRVFPLEEVKGFIRKPIQTEDLIQFTNQVTR
jgi:hypothetical protein